MKVLRVMGSLCVLSSACMAGSAWAQSSVVVYGFVDLALAQPIGSNDKQLADQAGSRLGFRGTEDLGAGLSAIFALEHRFDPDTGLQRTTRMWQGQSIVGLRHAQFGSVTLGRQYAAAFSLIQNQVDPWGGDTPGQLRDVGMRPQGSGIAKTRVSDSIRYDNKIGAVSFAASIGESTQADTGTGPDRPISVAANYAAGPLFFGVGYENPQFANDHLWNVGARYDIGPVTLSGGYASGKTAANRSTRGYLVAANVVLGPGEIKFGYANSEVAGANTGKKLGLGYHHSLSKRTKLYADVGRDNAIATHKTGYDFGIQHKF